MVLGGFGEGVDQFCVDATEGAVARENSVDTRAEGEWTLPAPDIFLPPGLGGLFSQHEGGDLSGLFLHRFVGKEQ